MVMRGRTHCCPPLFECRRANCFTNSASNWNSNSVNQNGTLNGRLRSPTPRAIPRDRHSGKLRAKFSASSRTTNGLIQSTQSKSSFASLLGTVLRKRRDNQWTLQSGFVWRSGASSWCRRATRRAGSRCSLERTFKDHAQEPAQLALLAVSTH